MTTQQSVSVNVDIYGQQYKLKGHNNAEYMKMVAQTIDESMTKLAKSYPILDTHKLAVLTAVQVSEEVFRLRKENSRLEIEEDRLKLTVMQIEEMQQKLVDAQKMLDSYKHQAAITLDEVKLQYEQQFSEHDQQHSQIVTDLKADYELEQSLQAESFANELAGIKAKYDETVELLQAQLLEATQAHQAELAKIIEHADQDKKLAIVQLKSRLETELAKQKVDYETLVKAYEDYRTKADAQTKLLEEQLATETTELMQLHELEVTNLTEQHEQQAAQLSEQISDLTSRYSSQVTALELEVAQLKDQLTELNQAKEADLQGFEQRLMQADEQLLKALETELLLTDTITQLESSKLSLSDELSDKLSALEQELEIEKKGYLEVSDALSEAQAAIALLKLESEQQLADVTAQLEDTSTYLLTSQNQTEQYKQKAEQQEQQIALLQGKLTEQEQHIASLNIKLDDQDQFIKLADDTLNEQTLKSKDDLAQLELEYRTVQIEQVEVISQLKADYERLLAEKEVSEQANKQMYDELLVEFEQMNMQKQQFEQSQVRAFKELEQELEQQLGAKTEIVQRLEQQLIDKTAEADTVVKQLGEKSTEVETITKQLVVKSEEAEQLVGQLKVKLEQEDEWLLQLEIKDEEAEAIVKQLSAKSAEVDEITQRLNTKSAEAEEVTQQLADKTVQLDKVTQQLKEKLEQEDEWMLQLEIKSEEVEMMAKQLTDSAELVSSLTEQLTVKVAEAATTKEQLVTLEKKIVSLEDLYIQVEIQKEDTEQELSRVQEQLNAKLKENQAIYEIQGQLLIAHKHVADVEAQRTAIAEQYKAAVAKSQELLQYLEMSAAKERLSENEKNIFNEELTSLQAKVQHYEAEKADLQEVLDRRASELQFAHEQIGLFESQLAQLEAAPTVSVVDDELLEHMQQLENRLHHIEGEHQKLQTEYSKLQTEYNEWIALLD